MPKQTATNLDTSTSLDPISIVFRRQTIVNSTTAQEIRLRFVHCDSFRRLAIPEPSLFRHIFACLAVASAAWCATTSCKAEYAIAGLSRETVGGTLGVGSDESNATKLTTDLAPSRHVKASNKPCLAVSALYQKQTLNSTLYDHILILDNQCSQPIKIRACYYKSSSCTVMRVEGYKRQQHNLGVSVTADFRFSFREYLN